MANPRTLLYGSAEIEQKESGILKPGSDIGQHPEFSVVSTGETDK